VGEQPGALVRGALLGRAIAIHLAALSRALYPFAGRDLSRLTTGARSSSSANDLALDVTESIKNDYGESA